MYRKIAVITALILLTVGVAALLVLFPEALLTFVFAFALTAAARPIANRLTSLHIPMGLAILLTYLFLLGGFIVILSFSITPVLRDLQNLSDQFIAAFENIRKTWPAGTPPQQWIAGRLPETQKLYSLLAGEGESGLAEHLMAWTSSFAGTVSKAAAVLILSIYWTLDRVRFDRLWLSLLPLAAREQWRDLIHDVENDLGAYIRSEAVQTLLAGLLIFTGLSLLHFPYPSLLGFIGAIFWLIPSLGPVMSLVPLILIGIWQAGPLTTILAVLAVVAIYSVLELVIEPRIFKRRRYSTWITILFIMALGQSFGLIGMVLGPPLATVVEILMRRVNQIAGVSKGEPTQVRLAGQMRELETRLDEIAKRAAMEDAHPRTRNLLERLQELTERASNLVDQKS